MLMMLLTCSVALLLAGLAFVGYDLLMARRALTRETTILADVLGNNSTAALSFNAPTTAEEMLSALKTQPHIVTACLYDRSGRVFAIYARPQATAHIPAQVENRRPQFESNRLSLFRPIRLSNKLVGTIYLESDLTELTERVHWYILVVLVKILLVMLVVTALALKLQDFISRPILNLTATAKSVAERRNYSARVPKTTEDELGLLTDAFNDMLTQIQHRDDALQHAHNELEERVTQRTTELSQANAALQREVGERQCAQAGLQIKAQELAHSNAELEQFAYIASHDLQEPVRMVSSYLQLLEHRCGDKLDGEAREFINFAVDGAARMRTLIKDLLEYSRVGRRKQSVVPIDCREVFETVLRNLQAAKEEAHATVTAGTLPTVAADPIEIMQVFQNLIGNAIKFHGPQPPVIRVEAARQDSYWQFSVRDNGIGIEPEYRDRIFVIFQRLHNRAEYPGNGLGLAICKKIVERYGGRIWVDSQLGQGSTFYFTLPAAHVKDSPP